MKFSIDDVVKINNEEYLVVDIIDDGKETYLYLINNNETKNDVSLVKVINNENSIEFSYIVEDEEFNNVLNKLILSQNNKLEEIIN